MPLNPLDDARYDGNDAQLAALKTLCRRQAKALAQCATFHAGLFDMLEGRRLLESDCPDDWEWLNTMLAKCATHRQTLSRYDLNTFQE